MEVREQQSIDTANRNIELVQANCRARPASASTSVLGPKRSALDQKLLIAGRVGN
jgi:hypothetical protein